MSGTVIDDSQIIVDKIILRLPAVGGLNNFRRFSNQYYIVDISNHFMLLEQFSNAKSNIKPNLIQLFVILVCSES